MVARRSIPRATGLFQGACVAIGLAYAAACGGTSSASPTAATSNIVTTPATTTATTTQATRFKAEVWADNWFAAYLGDAKIAEDSVPITTERSFNAETFFFTATYPFDLNFVIRDYIANDTGLEYIGQPNQQMGDGGFIMQITDTSTGKVVAVSSSAMRCLVIHKAPLNPSCEKDPNPSLTCRSRIDPEPVGWKGPGFDTTGWENATVYTAAQVGPKEGYNTISWDASARLVWTSDLKADNTLLCRLTVSAR